MLRFVAVAAVLSVLAGCIWVMGDTNGYGLPPCASAADCNGGACCVTLQNGAVVAACASTCGPQSVQLCKESSECPADAGCVTCADASATICGPCPLP